MNRRHPIFTEKNECQDCCKCVRNCPVKAIRVENGSAAIMPERCISCGHCVEVCPVNAKRVRDDLGRVRRLLGENHKVIVSLAPSFVTEFPGIPPEKLISAIKRLGFDGVSETALGAQEVSASVSEELKDQTPRILVSSACPVVVELVNKYMPDKGLLVTNLCSPLLAHCRLLKKEYGDDTKIVFIGPCIAKKVEADQFPELLDIAISFLDLRTWFEESGINPLTVASDPEANFIPRPAHEGALYPVDGGMIAGIKKNCNVADVEFMAFSGIEQVREALRDLDQIPLTKPLFLELLACEGGCVNGPQTRNAGATTVKRFQIFENAICDPAEFPREPAVETKLGRHGESLERVEFSEREIRESLASIGKRTVEDELNCAGCGYANCREFAKALLENKAEPNMCVSYMRKLAHKKANALIRSMPSGVAIISAEGLKIIECNRRFAEILGEENLDIYDAKPGMEGASAELVAPFMIRYFRQVLETGIEIVDHDICHEGAVYHLSIFSIEEKRIIGAIVQDITEPAVQKERVIKKAQEVIHRQMEAVQKIAYLLGENAAESQVSLNSIIDSFSVQDK